MNRDFVYNQDRPSPSSWSWSWSRAGSTLHRWLWVALCCGVPGIPCLFCSCCAKDEERDWPRVNQATATAERVSRPHRPHAPRGRKSTPEMLSAVRCALSQLQGDTVPVVGAKSESHTSEPGKNIVTRKNKNIEKYD